MFFQTDELPEIYTKYLSVEVVQYVTAVVGTTKLFRSVLGTIKGKWAVAATVAIGTAVGWVQFGVLGEQGNLIAVSYGILGGVASAGVFRAAKLVGKKVVKLNKQ